MVKQRRGGRFFGPRIDCEQVPLLPVGIVRRILSDPQRCRYLLIWKIPWNGAIEQTVRANQATF
jgi:hypothetical protein